MSDDLPLEEDFVTLTKDLIRQKILFTLTHYPALSQSMLQVGIGTGVPTKFWKAVLEELINEGKVKKKVFTVAHINGRDQTLKVISLVTNADSDAPAA